MPFVNRVLNPTSTGANVPALTASLHRELALLGTPIVGTEASNRTYGAATQASVREFQKRFELRETGELDPATVESWLTPRELEVAGQEFCDSCRAMIEAFGGTIVTPWLAVFR